MSLHDLSVLTEYEAGRAVVAIEWVARSGKPIVEIGRRVLHGDEIGQVASDLEHCIEISGESDMRGFVIREAQGWWQFGFYRYEWAMSALLSLYQAAPAIPEVQAHWVRGLLFGYDAEQIQRFISSESGELAATQHSCPGKRISQRRTVGIYDTPVLHAPPRSNQNGRSRILG